MNRPRNWLLPESVLLLPTIVTLFCTAGRSLLDSVIVPIPLFKIMVLVPPAALESIIAWRNEPAPLSLLLATIKSAASAGPANSAAASAPVNAMLNKRARPSDLYGGAQRPLLTLRFIFPPPKTAMSAEYNFRREYRCLSLQRWGADERFVIACVISATLLCGGQD